MFSQQSFLLLAALGMFERVNAHGRIVNWTVTGNGKTTTEPGQDYSPNDKLDTAQRKKPAVTIDADGYVKVGDPTLACWSTATSSERTYTVDAGSTVTTYWAHGLEHVEHWPVGHGGPIIEYMAACPDSGCDGVDAMTADWFKISENVLFNGQWASNKIMKDGLWDIKIPNELKKGHYLLRHEILSVHGVEGTPQIYPFCIQIDLQSSGSTVPEKTYQFPGIYTEFSQSYMEYQIKAGEENAPIPSRPFIAPGPPVYNGKGGSGGNSGGSGGEYTGGASGGDTAAVTSASKGAAGTSVTDIQAGASAAPSTSASASVSAQGGDNLASTASAYTPSASIDMNAYVNKGVVQPGDNAGTDPATIDKTLPSSSTTAQAAAATSQSASQAPPAGAPATNPATTNGGSEYASDIAGGACKANRWQCSTKDGKTILQVCNKNEQNVYEWQPSNDCPVHCFDSDPLLPDCL